MKQHLLIDKLRFRMARVELKLWQVSTTLNELIAKLDAGEEAVEENPNPNPHVWEVIDKSGLYTHMQCERCFENEEVALENLNEWLRSKETDVCPVETSA